MHRITHTPRRVPTSLGFRRGGSALAALLTAGVGCAFAAPASGPGSKEPASQPLAALLHDHVVRAQPNALSRRVETVAARRPLTRVRTVLPVAGVASSSGKSSWVRVRLPGRPTSHKGWISTRRTKRKSNEGPLSVDLSTRPVTG